MSKENTVLIGEKPPMSYVMAVMTQFSAGHNEVAVKARGRKISCAVDVAEISRKRIAGTKISAVNIGTEEIKLQPRENAKGDRPQRDRMNISTIEIVLTK